MSLEVLESRLVLSSADLGVAFTDVPLSVTSVKLTVTVTDHGPDPASGAALANMFTLPAGFSITSATPSQGTATVSGNSVSAALGTIAAQATATVAIVVTTTVNGSFSDTSTVSASTPDPNLSNNSATLSVSIGGLVSIALTPSTSSTSPNQPVTLSATVSGSATPTGSLTFLDGANTLGSAPIDASGHAVLVVPSFKLGTHAITASYPGDANNASGISGVASVYSGDGLKNDFDGDGKADLAVYGKDPATGKYRFKILDSSTGFDPTQAVVFDNQGLGFGNPSSIPVAADYFGDGKSAYAIFSPNGQGYMILQAISSVNPAKALSINFGLLTDTPVIADVDGDGKPDFGVFGYDPNLGYRYDFLLSSRGFDPKQPLIFNNYGYGYGTSAASPVVADFDGSGHAGFGVYIPSGNTGTFTYTNVTIPTGTTGAIVNPPASVYFARTYGFAADTPMAVDYDGDGKSDLAFYGLDPRTGRYRYDILTSSTNFDVTKDVYFDNAGFGYGYSATLPVMADYEGNGHADFAVFQPDGVGGASYIFQDVAVGHGVVYDFATATDLPVDAPSYLLAKKVRGH